MTGMNAAELSVSNYAVRRKELLQLGSRNHGSSHVTIFSRFWPVFSCFTDSPLVHAILDGFP